VEKVAKTVPWPTVSNVACELECRYVCSHADLNQREIGEYLNWSASGALG
jgi:hypothetical protein